MQMRHFSYFALLQPIYKLLLTSTNGKTILRSYKDNGRLKKTTRNLLSRLVIKHETDRAFENISINGSNQQLDKFVCHSYEKINLLDKTVICTSSNRNHFSASNVHDFQSQRNKLQHYLKVKILIHIILLMYVLIIAV